MSIKNLKAALKEAKESVQDVDVLDKPRTPIKNDIEIPAAELITGKSSLNRDKIRKIPLREIDPSECRPWKYHNRDSGWFNENMCSDLIQSISKNGQQEPALVREIKDDSDKFRYEVIYGMRRWYACCQIPNKRLLARVTDLSDKECVILMHSENADSKDITDSERAISFAMQLKSGLFKNQQEFANSLGMSQPNLSKLLKVAEIFEVDWVNNLFPNKIGLPLKYAYNLSVLLKKDYTGLLQSKAKEIRAKLEKGQVLTNTDILKKLIASTKDKVNTGTQVLLSKNKKPAIVMKKNLKGDISINFNKKLVLHENFNKVEQICIKAIKEEIFSH